MIVGTFEALSVGERFSSPARVVSEDDATTLIRVGDYTHPLFTDPAFGAASVFRGTPLPGEAVLHLMGGLAERTDRFDDTVIALVGFDEVRFRRAVMPGDEIRLEVEVVGKEPAGDGRGLLVMTWRCLNARDEVACEARARMLFRT